MNLLTRRSGRGASIVCEFVDVNISGKVKVRVEAKFLVCRLIISFFRSRMREQAPTQWRPVISSPGRQARRALGTTGSWIG